MKHIRKFLDWFFSKPVAPKKPQEPKPKARYEMTVKRRAKEAAEKRSGK